MMHEARTVAERHMLTVWWIRVVAMATGWDEDTVALIANREAHLHDMGREYAAAYAWAEWFPPDYRDSPGGVRGDDHCQVAHAPGGMYVCWVHRKFLPWTEPFSTKGCSCDG